MGPNRIVASAPYFPKGSHAVVVAVINSFRDKAYAVHSVPAGKETPGPAVGGQLGHQS